MNPSEISVLLDRDDDHSWYIVGVVTSEKSAIDWVEYWPEIRAYEAHKPAFSIPLATPNPSNRKSK